MFIQDIISNKKKMKKIKKTRNKLTPVLLVALIIFQTITGIFLPVEISPAPPYLEIKETHAAGWYSTGGTWDYRKGIIIDHTKVDMDLTNFAVLISVTDTDLADTDNSGHVVQSDGGDILFTNSDGDKLDHEIEKYTNTTGELVAWVEVDSLSSSIDTVLYIYYGSSVAGNQWDMNATWESSLKMVQHLQEEVTDEGTATDVHLDSTSNNNHGDQNGNDDAAAQIYKGQDFDGTDDYVEVSDSDSLDMGANDFSVSLWLKKAETADTSGNVVISKIDDVWEGFYIQADYRVTMQRIEISYYDHVGGDNYAISDSGLLNDTDWHHVVGMKDGLTARLYFDGTEINNRIAGAVGDINVSKSLYLGAWYEGSGPLNSTIDEVRIYNRALTLQEISTQYNNQKYPDKADYPDDGFYSIGSQVEGNTTPNIPTLVSPSNGSYTSDNTPTLSANYSDSDAGDVGTTNYRISSSSLSDCIDTVGINIVASGTSSATSDEDEDTEWTHSSSIGTDGTYYWCAQNNDGVATSAWTAMGNFILDTTGPTVVLVSPANNSSTGDSTPTLTWSGSDATSGIAKYQLYVDSSLDTDNISSSATSTTPTNSLSCGSHTWYVRAYDNVDNYTDSNTFNLTMACGSGLPPSASSPPTLPESTPENPDNNFSVTILRQAQDDNSTIVTLKLNAGSDTKRMAISNTEDFKYASQISYQEEINWDLSSGRDEAVPRLYDGEYTVYAKFYTQYGVASEVVSDSIILKTVITGAEIEEATSTETEEQSEDPNQEEPVSETGEDKDPESLNNSEPAKTNPSESSSFTFTKTLQFGSRGTEVANLQNKLKQLNFFPKEIESNGNFGPATEQAVIEYQKSKGIYPCGIVGPRTRKALNNEEFITNKNYQFTQDLKYNDKNEEVKELQTRLRDQNFFPYNLQSSGWFGPTTQKAVNIFQKFYNLIQSGVVDEGMREVLDR